MNDRMRRIHLIHLVGIGGSILAMKFRART
jgi:hypothetical protein